MKKKNSFPWTRREFLGGMGASLAGTTLGPSAWGQERRQPLPGLADWPRFAYDLHNTRFNSRESTLNTGNVGRLKLKWRHEVGAPIQSSPTVVGDSLFIGAWDGHFRSLDTETGEQKWKYDAGVKPEPLWNLRNIKSSAHYDSGKIFFGTGAGDVNCVDAATGENSGKSMWVPVCSSLLLPPSMKIEFSSASREEMLRSLAWTLRQAPSAGGLRSFPIVRVEGDRSGPLQPWM